MKRRATYNFIEARHALIKVIRVPFNFRIRNLIVWVQCYGLDRSAFKVQRYLNMVHTEADEVYTSVVGLMIPLLKIIDPSLDGC